MQRGIRKNTNRIMFPDLAISQPLIQTVMKGMIIVLCLYIAIKCVNLITADKAGEVGNQVVSDTSKMLAKEIVENGSVMSRYMLYIENHSTLTETAKKKVLDQIVSEYLARSEYTYDTSDPGYNQVINLIYENAGYTKEETTEAKPQTTNKKKKEKAVKTAAKVIVPMPKVTGKLYTADNLGSFESVINKFYIVTAATSIKESDMPIKTAMSEKFRIKGSSKKPQILIYHTHSQEEFCNSNGNESTTIVGVGERLAEILEEQFGYNVIHDKSTYDIVNGQLDRNEAYDQSRAGVKKILKKYPSISLILDIHRDGVNENTRLVTEVNGKSTAQVMFFNGMSRFKTTGDIDYLYNPYLYENLALALQMKVNAEAYYPGFARHNYVNAYKYNLDLCKQSMLIEVGAQTNTYQEERNAAEPLARLIDIVMGKKKK